MDYTLQVINEVNEFATTVGNALQLRGFKTGGTTGQVPVKNSGTDFDWSWQTVALPDLENVDHLTFDPAPLSADIAPGEMKWNAAEGCVSFGIAGGDIAIGKEIFDLYINDSGVVLVDGDAVSAVASNGNIHKVDLTDATDPVSAAAFVGIVTDGPKSDGAEVRVTKIGAVHKLDTSALDEGKPVYVDPANPGKWTKTMPVAPNYVVEIGGVPVKHATVGVIDVRPRILPKLQDLSDVNGTPLAADGQILVWDNTNKYFDATANTSSFAKLNAANSYTSAATFTYHTDAKTAHRNALGLGTGDAVSFDQLILAAGGTGAGTAPLKLTTQAAGLSVVEQGAFELIGNSLQFTQLLKRRGVAMSQSVLLTDVTVANTTDESATIIAAEHGANYLEVGKCEEIMVRGTIKQSVTGGGQLQVRIYYAGVQKLLYQTVSGNIAAGTPFELRVATTVRSTGPTGTMQINAALWIDGVANLPDAATLATIDTTTAQNTTITLKWTFASVDNTVTVNQGRVLCIEPNR